MASSSSGAPTQRHVQDLLTWFAKVGVSAESTREVALLARVAEVGKELLRSRAEQLIRRSDGAPLLVSYAADGTPIQTSISQYASHGAAKVRRIGKGTEEYYIQQAWYVYRDPHGHLQKSVVLSDPLPLTRGKRLPALLACALDFLQQPRSLSHEGVVIYHYAFDRGLYEGLTRLLRQWHMDDASTREATPHMRQVLYYLDWVMPTACALHGAHLGFRWAMSALTESQPTEFLQDIHIITSSVRASFNLIHDALPAFIARTLTLTPVEELDSEDDCHDLWVSLGVEPSVLQQLVELRLRWRNGCLQVSDKTPLEDVVQQVYFCLSSLWRFRKYSSGRWVGTGCTCRVVCAGLLTGLDALVDQITQDPDSSNYHINGWQKMQPSHREFIVQAAMASFLSENLTLALLEDCRVVRNFDQLSQIIEEEMEWVNRVPHAVWEALGGICGLSAQDIQSRCIRSTHVSGAFAHDRILAPASVLPWRLARGDVKTNLDDLEAGECPTEPTAAKIWHLLRLGWNRSSLEVAVGLFLQISWGVGPCEQQHASASLAARFHPDIGPGTMQVRGLIHTMRHLLPNKTPEERTQERLTNQLGKLKKRSPHKVNARHMFVKDLFGLLAKRKSELGPDGFKAARAKVWALHGGRWAQAPSNHKVEFASAAAAYQLKLEDEIADSQTELAEQLRLSVQRQTASDPDEQPPLQLSACRLTQDDLEVYQANLYSPRFAAEGFVQALRARAAEAPAPVSAATMQTLRAYPLRMGPQHSKQSWLASVARLRGFFSHCIFVFDTAHGREYFLFMYALQSPVEATFCRITRVDAAKDVIDLHREDWQSSAAADYEWTFAVEWAAITPWHKLPDVPEDKVSVLRESLLLGKDRVVADADPEPLLAAIGMFPEPVRGTEVAAKTARGLGPSAKDEVIVSYPWMQGVFEEAPTLRRKSMPSGSAVLLPEVETQEEEQKGDSDEESLKATKATAIADEVLHSAWDELASARAMVEPGQCEDFRVVVIGGKFTMQNRGLAFQGFSGQVRKGGEAEQWCHQYHLQMTSSYSSSWYGVEAAATCAREWCARLQYFFNIFRDSGDPVYKYTVADFEQAPQSPAYRDLVGRALGSQARRVVGIMDIRPMMW